VDAQGPAADVYFVGSVVERLAGAINSEPVPVVRLHIVFIGTAWRWTLPKVPIELRRNGHFFAGADGFARVVVPGLGEVSAADQTGMDLIDDFERVRRGALLCSHLPQLAVFLLRANQQRAFAGIVAAGLFNVDVLACFESIESH